VRPRRWLSLDAVVSLVMLAASITVIWAFTMRRPAPVTPEGPDRSVRAAPPLPSELLVVDEPAMGSKGAKVVVFEFSDFECPFCARFSSDVLPKLKTDYVDTGKVRIAFRHLPLRAIHRYAVPAARASACAANQGRFWDYHDRLFEHQDALTQSDLVSHAVAVGLDMEAFSACLEKPAVDKADRVAADSELAKRLGLAGTPVFLIGTVQADGRVKVEKILQGAQPLDEFRSTIDSLLSK
jgi:protein-disulfide isomerase